MCPTVGVRGVETRVTLESRRVQYGDVKLRRLELTRGDITNRTFVVSGGVDKQKIVVVTVHRKQNFIVNSVQGIFQEKDVCLFAAE